MLSAAEPDIEAVVALLGLTIARSPDDAPACIAAIAANVNGLGDSARSRLVQRIRPLVQKLLAEERLTPIGASAQLLAMRLNLAPLDAPEVRRWFASSSNSDERRLQALDALVAFSDDSLLDALPAVLASASPAFGSRVLLALGRMEDPKLADVVLDKYLKMSPELQPLAIDLLMQRERWARKLLDAVLAKKLPNSVLNANHLRKILESNDREAIWAVEKAFGRIREERNPQREKVVAEMAEFLRNNTGDPAAGHQVFKNLCGQCHSIYGEGGAVGPDITTNGRASFDQLLSNVFDPSLVIGPAYQVTTVVTKDGRNLTGVIAEDNEHRVVVRMPGEGEEVVPRNNVKYTRVSRLSMMPEGIESLLAKKDLADLFAFLSLDKPPADPTAGRIPGAPDPSGRTRRAE
jgi:putative heme-binding domain-containing protein